MPPKQTAEKINEARQYQAELLDITGRPLTPDNIDSYAEDALNDLISLIQRSIDGFSAQNSRQFATPKDLEAAAFAHYSLGNVEPTLDHIADKAAEISEIDDIIAGATQANEIITPPDLRPSLVEGGGTFHERLSKPRLKTLLFVLGNEFNVDLRDNEQITITRGRVDPTMMRHESYNLVELPRLNRTVLICDEEENATFVFDDQELRTHELSSKELAHLSKFELRDLIAQDPHMGSWVKYSKKFVPRLVAALKDPGQVIPVKVPDEKSYLFPAPPDDVRSMSGLTDDLEDVAKKTVTETIEKLRAQQKLGQEVLYRFRGGHIVPGYDLYQQALIEDRLRTQGLLVPRAPEGVLSVAGIVREYPGHGYHTVERAVETLKDELGTVGRYRFRQERANGYTGPQQKLIIDLLENEREKTPPVPEGHKSASGIADDLGVDKKTVNRKIAELDDTIGEKKKYQFNGFVAVGYSPDQQKLIKEYFTNKWRLKDRVKAS